MSNFLVGKTIKQIKIADDDKALLFVCDDGEHIIRADGDCCSSTWIESVETPALGFPCKVIEVKDLDMPDREYNEDEYEYLAFYGCSIKTDKGEIVIDYRNESNGYYGGNLSWPDDGYFYGGVYGQNVSSENWVELEGDK